ncbi:hypothetical protein DMC14_002475 [Metamycoplasma phocicerebrale]|uniref:Uncharacterized protein n=1 Tax=Metamycoplasma phocicerebrale TaxID=142649 RepID=A0A3T0TUK2_9BACT|nr:hypothetical protein [Metamycoplasma phocicerebrale]AZZ65636.1 hypothetical protein DMC14_002475 [Metamycoplasma phocicerebrale]
MENFVRIFFVVIGFMASIYIFTIGIILFTKNLKRVFHRVAYCALSGLLPISVYELSLLVNSARVGDYTWLSISIILLIFIIASSVIFMIAGIMNVQRSKTNKNNK